MQHLILLLVAALLATGCASRNAIHVPYHADGTCKLRVALIPVMDTSEACIPWDISEELSNSFRFECMCREDIYLLEKAKVDSSLDLCGPVDLFGRDLAFGKKFCDTDLIVALELIEHDLTPFQGGLVSNMFPSQCMRYATVLQMKMRVRIIDVRSDCPKIILQETFTSNYMIPREGECIDYNKLYWGTRAYASTPIGLAHKKLVRDLATRVHSVILGY